MWFVRGAEYYKKAGSPPCSSEVPLVQTFIFRQVKNSHFHKRFVWPLLVSKIGRTVTQLMTSFFCPGSPEEGHTFSHALPIVCVRTHVFSTLSTLVHQPAVPLNALLAQPPEGQHRLVDQRCRQAPPLLHHVLLEVLHSPRTTI